MLNPPPSTKRFAFVLFALDDFTSPVDGRTWRSGEFLRLPCTAENVGAAAQAANWLVRTGKFSIWRADLPLPGEPAKRQRSVTTFKRDKRGELLESETFYDEIGRPMPIPLDEYRRAIVPVGVGVPISRRDELRAANKAVPDIQTAPFLFDTGATHSMVDADLLRMLDLAPIGTIPIYTASTGPDEPCARNQYEVALHLPPLAEERIGGGVIDTIAVLESDLGPVSYGAYKGVIGRDILAVSTFTFSGPTGTFSWSY